MIATKKAKLIRKHLGSNTPEWVVKNCIELLKEYEEIEWCCVPEKQANGANTGHDKCHIQLVNNLAKLAEFVRQQKDLPPEINDIVNDNFWDLI